MNEELFNNIEKNKESIKGKEPLAYRMRPHFLEDFVGQEHLLGKDSPLYKLIISDNLASFIFYGPPGSGKTALAFLIASITKKDFISINAITSSVSDIRKITEEARWKLNQTGKKTIFFIDEISHFNKTQQDAIMPEVENGTIILIGATTQNPFFFINKALVSRCMIFEFKSLTEANLEIILKKSIADKKYGLGNSKINLTQEAIKHFVKSSEGDARRLLNYLEIAFYISKPEKDGSITISQKTAEEAIQKKYIQYDREDEHYDTISAFIKSMRGSDPDAAIYYLAKMLIAGEDPRFIARRILIFASEDIGNADPMALVVATSTFQAVELIGMPEVQINLAQATIYLASAPKSNASYMALQNAKETIEKEPVQKVPKHLQHTGYEGAKSLGRGTGYLYPHDYNETAVEQKYMEKKIKFYFPKDAGYEKKIKDFLEHIDNLKKQ